ncbi:MAG: hypothetical protein KAQ92_02245 [Candidatus Aenigmarchaeota archaeon]|nr:hypothetical protein [Candidatus Aenigmarchaeota archaeon]
MGVIKIYFVFVVLFFSSVAFAQFSCNEKICLYSSDVAQNISNLKFETTFNVFNNNTNESCFDIRAYIVGQSTGNDWLENNIINYSQNKTFNYTIKLGEIQAIEQKDISIYARYCSDSSSKTTIKIPVALTKIIAKPKIENIYAVQENNLLHVNTTFENPDDDENVSGSFYIKLECEGEELQRKEIDFLELQYNKTCNYSFAFNVSDYVSGEYKLYARYTYNNSYFDTCISKSKYTNISGMGDDLKISQIIWNKTISSDPTNISFFLNNTGENFYQIDTKIKIYDLKTSDGKIDYSFSCDSKNISKEMISFNCSFCLPNETIEENEKEITTEFHIFNQNKSIDFVKKIIEIVSISGLEDIGEPEFELKTNTTTLLFNSFSLVHAHFSSGSFSQKLRFVCYASPKSVLSDLDGIKISSDFCNKNTATQINTESGENYDIFIPIFSYPNCDNYYDAGEYKGYCRICKYDLNENKWSYYSSSSKYRREFTININGQNACALNTITESCSCSDNNEVSSKTKGDYIFENVVAPKTAKRNEKIDISFILKNTVSTKKTCKVRSYIYLSQKTANIGGWSPNEKQVELNAYESKYIVLDNTIKPNINEGTYNYRLRVIDSDTAKQIDYTTNIQIKGIEKKEEIKSVESKSNAFYDEGQNEKESEEKDAELFCSVSDEKIKVVIKNNHKSALNFSLFIFGLKNKEKHYFIKRQKTIYFSSKNNDSKIFFIIKYKIDNIEKYSACSVFINKTTENKTNEEKSILNISDKKQKENQITGRTIHVKKKGVIDGFVD